MAVPYGGFPLMALVDLAQPKAGAKYLVSPGTPPDLAAALADASVPVLPGCATVSEAMALSVRGFKVLKFFPAEVLGPAGIKAMTAVLPGDIPLYAVVGANPDTFAAYFTAGCSGFGLGTYLYKPSYSLEEIATRAKAAVAAYDNHRKT